MASSAIEELLVRPEVLLIKDAAFALGSTGLRGADNPAAMAFYATTLHFTNALAVEEEDIASGELEDGGTPERVRRWGWLDPSLTVWCSNSRSHCVNCPVGEKCYGLCGAGGSFVVIVAGTLDAIGTIDMHVPMDETH